MHLSKEQWCQEEHSARFESLPLLLPIGSRPLALPYRLMIRHASNTVSMPIEINTQKAVAKDLKYFCTYENGLQYGRQGYVYRGVCPSGLEVDFLKGHDIGIMEYRLIERERGLERRQRQLERRQEEFEERERRDKRRETFGN